HIQHFTHLFLSLSLRATYSTSLIPPSLSLSLSLSLRATYIYTQTHPRNNICADICFASSHLCFSRGLSLSPHRPFLHLSHSVTHMTTCLHSSLSLSPSHLLYSFSPALFLSLSLSLSF